MKKIGVLRFLGTNCDTDVFRAVENSGAKAEWIWYSDRFEPKDFNAFVLPGGFSYGDYLRSGALAARSPAMVDLKKAADLGQPILGICNGFQILCEAGLLPGALVKNANLRFVDRWEGLRLQSSNPFWGQSEGFEKFELPVAHGDGRFYAGDDELKELQDNEGIWWTYKNNPNGSLLDIAGVQNKNKNVAGLMPHPERAMEPWMGSDLGRRIFETVSA